MSAARARTQQQTSRTSLLLTPDRYINPEPHTTPCPKNVHLLFFEQHCQKITDVNDFFVLNPEKICHENLTDLSTSLSDVATLLCEIQKSFLTALFIHTCDYLCCLRRKKTVIHLPTSPENVTTLTCELQNFFI